MFNIVEQQQYLESFSDDMLTKEAQQPTGQYPQFLIMTELQRRKDLRQRAQAQAYEAQPTVAEKLIQETGSLGGSGIPGADQGTPSQDPAMQQGIAGMANGGQVGGTRDYTKEVGGGYAHGGMIPHPNGLQSQIQAFQGGGFVGRGEDPDSIRRALMASGLQDLFPQRNLSSYDTSESTGVLRDYFNPRPTGFDMLRGERSYPEFNREMMPPSQQPGAFRPGGERRPLTSEPDYGFGTSLYPRVGDSYQGMTDMPGGSVEDINDFILEERRKANAARDARLDEGAVEEESGMDLMALLDEIAGDVPEIDSDMTGLRSATDDIQALGLRATERDRAALAEHRQYMEAQVKEDPYGLEKELTEMRKSPEEMRDERIALALAGVGEAIASPRRGDIGRGVAQTTRDVIARKDVQEDRDQRLAIQAGGMEQARMDRNVSIKADLFRQQGELEDVAVQRAINGAQAEAVYEQVEKDLSVAIADRALGIFQIKAAGLNAIQQIEATEDAAMDVNPGNLDRMTQSLMKFIEDVELRTDDEVYIQELYDRLNSFMAKFEELANIEPTQARDRGNFGGPQSGP